MAGELVQTPVNGAADWSDFIFQVERMKKGFYNIDFTTLADGSTAPEIKAGSWIEVDGNIFKFTSQEAAIGWGGIGSLTISYMKVVPAGTSITAEFTTSAPTYYPLKNGWYNGDDRYILWLYKDISSDYTNMIIETEISKRLSVVSGNVGIATTNPAIGLDVNGAIRSGSLTIATATHQDALDVSGVNVILCNTASVVITIGGLAGGVVGQVVHLVKLSTLNNLVLEHTEGSGAQKIYTQDSGDLSIGFMGGATLVFEGTYWKVSGNAQTLNNVLVINSVTHYDDLDISGYNTIRMNCNNNIVTLGGLSGGTDGQILHICRAESANSAVIEHNEGTATQGIYTPSGGDVTLPGRGGVTIVCIQAAFWVFLGQALS